MDRILPAWFEIQKYQLAVADFNDMRQRLY